MAEQGWLAFNSIKFRKDKRKKTNSCAMEEMLIIINSSQALISSVIRIIQTLLKKIDYLTKPRESDATQLKISEQ